MAIKKPSRRNFLIGAAGTYLTIPLLPSLLPKSAWAQVAARPKRFIGYQTPLGTVAKNWYPVTNPTSLIAPNVRTMNLNSIAGNISTILGSEMSAHRSKLLLLRGLDGQALSSGHNSEEILAGSTPPDGQNINNVSQHISIDRILGASSKVYDSEPKTRVLSLMGQDKSANISYMSSGGSIVRAPYYYDMKVVFDVLFSGMSGNASEIEKAKVKNLTLVDRVHESYRKIANSTKISKEDKLRLDSHIDHIHELEKRINESKIAAGCVAPSTGLVYPGRKLDQISSTAAEPYLTNLFDIVVAALRCDLTRVITIVPWNGTANFSALHPDLKDIHQVSHFGTEEKAVEPATIWQQSQAKKFAEFLSKLDGVIDDPNDGSTILDHTVVLWRQEFAGMGGDANHKKIDLPVILAGGTKFLNSGRMVDYRIHGKMRKSYDATFVGVPYNQMLVTMLQAFGLTPTEYEQNNEPGYGWYNPAPENPWEMTDAKKRLALHSIIKS